MKLSELIYGIPGVFNGGDADILDISDNSKEVKPGSLFIAYKGSRFDGADFILEAKKNGAVAFVSYRPLDITPLFVPDDFNKAISTISSRFFGNPSSAMKVIGVTGTNGKTTFTYIVESILKSAGVKCGVIGTINYRVEDEVRPAPNTTPLPVELTRTMKWMKDKKAEFVVMEVSSHSLALNRVDDVDFDVAVFLNCTPEHLDFHNTFDEYLKAKLKIFELLKTSKKSVKTSVFNYDDENRNLLLKAVPDAVKYSIVEKTDVYAYNIKADISGTSFMVSCGGDECEFSTNLIGYFNVSNILAAISSLTGFMPVKDMVDGVKNLKYVDGRFMPLYIKGRHIIIDYAHTPQAFEAVFKNVREFYSGRIITVFGCGGNRDTKKRPVMGSIAAKNSNFLVITSDNPRYEDPLKIIDQILAGVKDTGFKDYKVISDRRQAIYEALRISKRGDVILILGKGHERYQIIAEKKEYFYDPEVVMSFEDRIED